MQGDRGADGTGPRDPIGDTRRQPVAAVEAEGDRLGQAVPLVRGNRTSAGFTHSQPYVFDGLLVETGDTVHADRDQPSRPDQPRVRDGFETHRAHGVGQVAVAAAMESWMAKTLVSPVMSKILSRRS